MIERPNRAVLNEALDEFRDAMRPFIARGMRRIKGKTIETAIHDSLSDRQARQFRANLQDNDGSIEGAIDIGDFPNLIRRNWGLFSPQFRGDMNVQSLLYIITKARHKASHPSDEDLDTEYTRVVLYHIVEVLDKINALEAKGRVERKRDKLFPVSPKPLPPEPPADPTSQKEQFWTQLRDAMVEKDSRVRCPKPNSENFLIFSIGRTNFSMEAWQASRNKEIGIRLYVTGQDATAHFYLLKEQQAEIEEAFGEPLEWAEMLGKKSCRISLRKGDMDPTDVSDWPKQHEWLADKLERFNTVFRPRIQALDAANYNPLADADDG